MKPTINDYIKASFVERAEAEELKRKVIDNLHNQVADRITFSLPLVQINSYNVQSCIVQLDENEKNSYYNILDHSMLDFCEWFLLALEYNQPNLVVATYRELKRYICIANSDIQGAEFYQLTKVFYTDYELERENHSMSSGIQLSEKYEMMIRFHFLHEYGHYLINQPLRDYSSSVEILDIIVGALFNDMDNKRLDNPQFSPEQNDTLNKLKPKLLEYYRKEYAENTTFKEEVLCDFQAVLCLLELSNDYSPQMIIESAIMYLYVQYAIWLAKASENEPRIGEILHFRINFLFEFADFLNDKDIADSLAERLNRDNRYSSVKTTHCDAIDYMKYHRFYNALATTLFSEKKRKSESQKLDHTDGITPLDDIILI